MKIHKDTTVEEIADMAVEDYAGDLVEIGAGDGINTGHFLVTASMNKRKVFVIDPFEEGWPHMPESYGKPYPLQKFKDHINLLELNDWLVLLRSSSQSDAAKEFLRNKPLAFAFVDGLQTKDAILSDLELVKHAHVVVVDDMNRSTDISQTPEAIEEYMKTSNDGLIITRRYAVLIKNKYFSNTILNSKL